MNPERRLFFVTLEKYVPGNAVHYCYDLWLKYRFSLKITRRRNSKLGDYRYDPVKKIHFISVNHDLNKFSFLITYIHEAAHLAAFVEQGRAPKKPHGKEWQRHFKELLSPMLSDLVFPEDILSALRKHMSRPKASSCSDPELYRALRKYDRDISMNLLSEILPGEKFVFHKRVFEKEALKRTRAVCKEVNTGRKYLIPELASVKKLPGA